MLSGHRGLPSAKLFTNLDQLVEGDTFTIRVLDEVLTYEVDQILIVEPEDVSALEIVPGRDLCTLVTCTPYGINTHRLLVRGTRIENEPQAQTVRVTSDAVQIEPLLVAPVLAAPVLLILAAGSAACPESRNERRRKTDMRARRVFCLLLAACLLAGAAAAGAGRGSIDLRPDSPVTLTVRFFHDKAPVSGAPFSLYRVADVSAYGEFTLTGDFKDDPVRSGRPEQRRLARAGRDAARLCPAGQPQAARHRRDRQHRPSHRSPTGRKRFGRGCICCWASRFVSGGYSYTVEPSLICLPCAGETSNTWDYDAALAPKHDREPLPPAPSDDTVERKVLKVWDDGNAASQPQEITVQLLKDGVVYDTVRLNAKNSWRYTWSKLPKYDASGRRITWTVTETAVGGYTVSIRQEGVTFVVTNSRTPSTPAQPSTPSGPSLPQMGTVWWPVGLLAICGVALLLAGLRCGKGKRDA